MTVGSNAMTKEEISKIFESEFTFITQKFVIIEEKVKDLAKSTKDYVFHPGVYIFLNNDDVIKVGRHLTNSRKRALEHIQVNTKNEYFEMKTLADLPNSIAILLNVKCKKDCHWVAAAEIFLEEELKPMIKSKRKG
jgi:hypothetical protein